MSPKVNKFDHKSNRSIILACSLISGFIGLLILLVANDIYTHFRFSDTVLFYVVSISWILTTLGCLGMLAFSFGGSKKE